MLKQEQTMQYSAGFHIRLFSVIVLSMILIGFVSESV